jgi:chromosome segregation ATPase
LEGELLTSQQLLQDQDTHIRKLEKQLVEASSALDKSENKYKSLQSNVSNSRQGYQTEIGQTPEMSETRVSDLNLQLQALERQLNSANQTISSLRRDLENSAEASRVAQEELMDERRESEIRVDKLRNENGRLEATRLDSDERITQLAHDVAELRRDHADEIERIKNGHILHVSGVRKKAEDAVRRTSDVIEKWKSEAKRLREEMAQGQEKTAAHVSELEDLRNELLVANDRAEDMQRERDNLKLDAAERVPALHASRIEAIRAKKRGDELQKEVLILRSVDTHVDKKIAALMQKRDQYWRQKMDMMEKDLEIRGKLLMLEWGRDEVGGPKIPQGYKYQQYRRA